MLLSMTGFGEAQRQQDALAIGVEVRAINSRYFKLSVRASEGYASLEPRIEEVVRQTIRRGTIQVNLRVNQLRPEEKFKINVPVLDHYRTQLQSLYRQWNMTAPLPVEALLALPGVADEGSCGPFDPSGDWPVVCATLEAAMENLAKMRAAEGQAMATDLLANCRGIATGLDAIERRAPGMVEGYRNRLEERLKKLLADYKVTLDAGDLIKEVSLFAERSDISEEVVRLRSHLVQFESTMGMAESAGRKLEFLTQEMFREANTIGSKANDVEISQWVIEIKTAIERIREMIQNIE